MTIARGRAGRHDWALLRELAQVRQGVGPARELVRLDGKPAVLLSVIKAEDINTLDLTRSVRELVANALIHQDFFVTGAGPISTVPGPETSSMSGRLKWSKWS